MVIIRIILITLFFTVLINKPTYMGVRADFTNWEWGLSRMPLWKAIISYYFHGNDIEIEFAKVKYVKEDK